MDQIDQLWVTRYVPEAAADTLQAIIRADYFDDDGDLLGFIELFRTRGAQPAPVYLMRTGRTIVFGEVYAPLAERVSELWSAAAEKVGPNLDQTEVARYWEEATGVRL